MAHADVKDMSEDVGADNTSSSEEASGSEEEMGSWVAWFCSLKGNEFFCEVDEDYIQDDFNLSGLSTQVAYYDYALELILDADAAQDEVLTEAQQAAVEQAAEALYGLIHARFILTARGLAAMAEHFRAGDFGRCPRVLCGGQACLPVGLSDAPRQSTVKLFCPRCEDVYYPRSKYHGNLDGAYFGTTFPHLFLLTYPALRPPKPTETYIPRVFGFRISPKAYEAPQAARQPPDGAQQGAGAAREMAADGAGPSGQAGDGGVREGGGGATAAAADGDRFLAEGGATEAGEQHGEDMSDQQPQPPPPPSAAAPQQQRLPAGSTPGKGRRGKA